MEYIFFLIGVIVGSIIVSIIHNCKSSSGTLKIDHSNPEKDVYRLEINNLDSLNKKKYVVLKVDHDAKLTSTVMEH